MFCSHCGAPIDKDSQYCSGCGSKLTTQEKETPSTMTSSFSPTNQEEPLYKQPKQTHSKRPMPLWFKILSILAVLALIGVTVGILFTESLVDVIDNQLDALRRGDISKAYHTYTSKEFQESTSLEQFQDFIQAYPIFLNNQSAHFTQRSIKDNVGILKGNLTASDHKKVPVEYKLVKEEGKWKILSIRLLQPGMLQAPQESVKAQELISIIKAQLHDLENQNIAAAYQKYTSEDFKDATSQEAFQEFVKKYPILTKEASMSFHKPVTKDGISTISVILKSQDTAAYLKYYLIYENQTWKIWSMRILSPSEEEKTEKQKEPSAETHPTGAMVLSDVKLGNQIDKNGIITSSQTRFESNTDPIYVNVEITNGVKGDTVYLNFQHLDSGSFIPAKATIEENGDTILMSTFSPPAEGWPKGHYKLVVTTSKGLNKILNFEID